MWESHTSRCHEFQSRFASVSSAFPVGAASAFPSAFPVNAALELRLTFRGKELRDSHIYIYIHIATQSVIGGWGGAY